MEQRKFSIWACGNIIGDATVVRQGLYYNIHCICREATGRAIRVHVRCGDRYVDLGICIPMEGYFGLRTKVPVKRLGEGEFQFTADGQEKIGLALFYPVDPNKPFKAIAELKNSRLATKGGQTGITVISDQISKDKPTGQWSEPYTSE